MRPSVQLATRVGLSCAALSAVIVLAGCSGSASGPAAGSAGTGSDVRSPVATTPSPGARSVGAPRTPSDTGGSSVATDGAPPAGPLAPYTPPANLPVHAGAPRSLPLGYPVKNAQQAVVVTVPSARAVFGTIQGWVKVGAGWVPFTAPARATVGRDGVTATPRETVPATPEGSFTLTQAFGRLADPGTALPYFHTTPADWWISQPGPLYNTHQVCTSQCAFVQGSPNTQLATVVPQYDLGLVIDYNRYPVRQGAGSGFFLHVTRGIPTNGCASTDQQTLTALLRWLQPAAHPRILIGVTR